jgi:pyruvate/2-oxoglutarate/acetoin dehydrogenase E1 component
MPEKTYLQAISDGLRQEMRRDKRVFIIGEDVGVYGGAFKVTLGFQEEFGPWRVLDAPLSETAILGGATGAAIMGMRPVAEMQFADFISCGWDHLVTVAAKQRWRVGTPVPITVRLPSGGGFSGGPFHSQNPESSFAHIPGLKCVCPATPEDAKGLLISAIEDPNPVLFFEHKHLYRRIKGEVPNERYTTPIGEARVHREGTDVTVITWGAMVYTAEEAASKLDDLSVEIIDLRTILPWDKDAVLASVRKTSKALVLHEDTRTGGFGAEIAATIAEEAFEDLDGPVRRIAAPDTPVPFSPALECQHDRGRDGHSQRYRQRQQPGREGGAQRRRWRIQPRPGDDELVWFGQYLRLHERRAHALRPRHRHGRQCRGVERGDQRDQRCCPADGRRDHSVRRSDRQRNALGGGHCVR